VSRCPAPELLDAFADGTLGEHTAARLAEHVDDCPMCQARLRALDPLDGDLVHLDAPDVPEALVLDVVSGKRDRQRLITRWILGSAGALLPAAALTRPPWGEEDYGPLESACPEVLERCTLRPWETVTLSTKTDVDVHLEAAPTVGFYFLEGCE